MIKVHKRIKELLLKIKNWSIICEGVNFKTNLKSINMESIDDFSLTFILTFHNFQFLN